MHDRSHTPQPAEAGNGGPAGEVGGRGGNVDRVLFKNLVEMVPLVESLMVSKKELAGAARAADLAGAAGVSALLLSELVSMRCLTLVPCCFFFLGAGPEGQPGLLASRFAGLHAGAAQEGLLPPSPPSFLP